MDAITGGLVVGFFPSFLRHLAARFITNVPKNTKRALNATVESLAKRVLTVNTAAIHTSANPLREEVEAIVEEEGWSRTSLSKMRKVDSFLRKSIRLDGIVSQLPPSTCPLVTAYMRDMIVPRRLLLMIIPGCFFAGLELKTMLAHIVMTYYVKLEEHMPRPQSLRIASSIAADPTANVMFRKRAPYGEA
ncbi:hypothetical protein V8E55_000051 [Tylopilus felleus]